MSEQEWIDRAAKKLGATLRASPNARLYDFLVSAEIRLRRYESELQKVKQERDEAVELLKDLVGHNLPMSYYGDEDEVGACPYCQEVSYKSHSESCEAGKAEAFLNKIGDE